MFDYLKKEFISKFKYIKKEYILIIVLSIILSIFAFFLNKKSIFEKDYTIKRGGFGDGKITYGINVDIGDEIKNKYIVFDIEKKKYKLEEVDEICEYAFDECLEKVLGNNVDFYHIENDLKFFSKYKDGIEVVWKFNLKDDKNFDDLKKYYKLVEKNGKLNNDLIDEEYVEGFIDFYFKIAIENSEKKYKSEVYSIPIVVLPKEKTNDEILVDNLKQKISERDKKTIVNDYVKLPDEIDGKKVKYKEKIDFSFLYLPILGVIVVIILCIKEKNDIKEKLKKKYKQMELVYPKMITKMLIYIESGMTIRNTICKIAKDYKKSLERKLEKQNIVYDKLYDAKVSLENGIIESKVYERIAFDLSDRRYSRFFNILIQNIKNGTKDFRNILLVEANDSLQEKKTNAKKQGEEAATKLIIPLLMELMIIMAIIIVPAFMSMQ